MPRRARLVLLASVVTLAAALVGPVAASGGGSRPAASAERCGTERWNVKTLQDAPWRTTPFPDRSTTVATLRGLRVPRVSENTRRIRGVETTIWRVRARLVGFKLEADSDIHLVVADPASGGTMIAELPSATCVLRAMPLRRGLMRRARNRLVAACGAPTGRYQRLSGSAILRGVGFVDEIHGQTGVAPNGIELHPVLGIAQLSCGVAASSRPKPKPRPRGNCDPSYPGVCIPPPPPDLDCADIPYRNFRVVPPDPHRFDGDHDGIGCES